MKKAALVAVTLAVTLVVGVGLFASKLDAIVAKLIDSEGDKVTGTDVAVSGVEISLKEGRGAIAGLTIASPDGFDPPHAFALGGIGIALDLGSLRDEPIVIDEIRVSDPQVAAQVLADGSSNIGALQRNVQQFAAAQGGAGGSGGKAEDAKDAKRLRIRRFAFDGGRIALDATALGDKEPRAVDLPAFTIDDIGGPAGALPDEIAKAVLAALTREAAEAVAKSGVKEKAKDMLEDEAEKAAKGLFDKYGG